MIKKYVATGVLLVALAAGVAFSVSLLLESKARENYVLFGFTSLVAVIVYMTTMLDFRISGANVAVEKAKSELYAARADVVEIANTLVKMSAIVADGSGRYGGFPEVHKAKVNEYIRNLRALLSDDIDRQVDADVEAVRTLIDARLELQKKEKLENEGSET